LTIVLTSHKYKAVCVCLLGASPYPGVAAERLCNMLSTGYRMDKPTTCSDELYVCLAVSIITVIIITLVLL